MMSRFTSFDLEGYLVVRAETLRSGRHLCMACINPDCPDFSRSYKKRLWVRVEEKTGYCYRCSKFFDVPNFVMFFEHCTYRKALDFIRQRSADDDVSGSLAQIAVRLSFRRHVETELPLASLPQGFLPVRDTLPKFASDRGLTVAACRKYGIGWCETGYYADRLIIPVYHNKRLVSWVGRAMWKVPSVRTGEREDGLHKKVVNAPNTNTGRLLFNYDRAKDKSRIILVEGPFDAMAVGNEAVALFGTHLSTDQYRLLLQTKAKKLVVLLDPDKAGRSAAVKIAERLRAVFPYVSVPQISGDPDDLSAEELAAALKTPPNVSLLDHVASSLS